MLKSIYHVRVEYPDQDDNNTEKQNGSPKKVNTKTQNELQNKKPDTAVKPQDSEQSEGNEEKK